MGRYSIYGVMVAAGLAFAIGALGPVPIQGQDAPKAVKGGKGGGKGPTFAKPVEGKVPRTADGQPDLNGVWLRPYTPDMTKGGREGTASVLKFTAWGQKNWENYHAEDGDYAGACLPFGLIRSINAPHPMQIVQSKNSIAFLHEQNTWFTKITTDGRPHPKDVDPTWFGDSRGTWKDDVLTIDTIGFNGKTRLDTIGHPHSDQMHVVETWKLMNENQVYYTIRIEDPKTYTEAITSERVFTRHPEMEVLEYACEENNKSLWEGRIKPPNYDTWK